MSLTLCHNDNESIRQREFGFGSRSLFKSLRGDLSCQQTVNTEGTTNVEQEISSFCVYFDPRETELMH